MTNTSETKRNAAITATIDEGSNGETTVLTLRFANGKVLQLDAYQLSLSIRNAALYHGLKQKLVDAAAISRNPENGRAASIDDKYNAVKAVYDRLLAGQWNAVREGGAAGGGLLFRALCRMYEGKKTAEDIANYLESKTDAEKTALRKNPKVAAIIEAIRAESGKPSNVDTDALLDELED